MVVAAACMLMADARPQYVLVPLQDMPLMRLARSLRHYQPAQARSGADYAPVDHGDYQNYAPVDHGEYAEEVLVPQASDSYHHVDPHSHNDHVDYGAYTGGYGAYGWYSDHPVCVNCGLYHR